MKKNRQEAVAEIKQNKKIDLDLAGEGEEGRILLKCGVRPVI